MWNTHRSILHGNIILEQNKIHYIIFAHKSVEYTSNTQSIPCGNIILEQNKIHYIIVTGKNTHQIHKVFRAGISQNEYWFVHSELFYMFRGAEQAPTSTRMQVQLNPTTVQLWPLHPHGTGHKHVHAGQG